MASKKSLTSPRPVIHSFYRFSHAQPSDVGSKPLNGNTIGNICATITHVDQGPSGNPMALTRNFKDTVVERVQSDASFAQALLDEAATLFLNGEPETARLILRDLVNATMGFEQLAALTAKPSKSLHRMLSPKGNPSMDNLAAIFRAVRERLQVNLSAHSVAA
jgi:DNA-binding phage protein